MVAFFFSKSCLFLTLFMLYHAFGWTIDTGLTYGQQTYGHMFDIQVKQQPISIQIIDAHFSLNGINANIEIYTKRGTWVGYDSNITQWNLIHSDQVINTKVNELTRLGWLQNKVIIHAGQTQAFYIRVNGVTFEYGKTNNVTGNVFTSNDHLRLMTGISKDNFGSSIKYNVIWDGYIYYEYECDQFQLISDPGTYTLYATQNQIPADPETICYQIESGYTCQSPHILIITDALDYDDYTFSDEYIEINYTKNGVKQKQYNDCYDESEVCSCCNKFITCVNEAVNDTSFENGILYQWSFKNGPGVDALCSGRTMDIEMKLTCLGTKSPTPAQTKIDTSHCDEYIEINGYGDHVLHAFARDQNSKRVLCWTISPEFTCYNPHLSVISKQIDYDNIGEWVRPTYRINRTTVTDYGECRGGALHRCDLTLNCVDSNIDGPLIYGSVYEIELDISPNVHSSCNPIRTIDAIVTISCNGTNNPTLYPSILPTESPSLPTPILLNSTEPTIATNSPVSLSSVTPSIVPSIIPSVIPSVIPSQIQSTTNFSSTTVNPTNHTETSQPPSGNQTPNPTEFPSKTPSFVTTNTTSITSSETTQIPSSNNDSERKPLLLKASGLVIIITISVLLFCVIMCLAITCAYRIGVNKTKQKVIEAVMKPENNSSTFTSTPNGAIEISPMSLNKQLRPKRLHSVSEDQINGYLSTPGSDRGPLHTSREVIAMQQEILTIAKSDSLVEGNNDGITTNNGILPTPGNEDSINMDDLYDGVTQNELPNDNDPTIDIDDINTGVYTTTGNNNDNNSVSNASDNEDILYTNTQTNGET